MMDAVYLCFSIRWRCFMDEKRIFDGVVGISCECVYVVVMVTSSFHLLPCMYLLLFSDRG